MQSSLDTSHSSRTCIEYLRANSLLIEPLTHLLIVPIGDTTRLLPFGSSRTWSSCFSSFSCELLFLPLLLLPASFQVLNFFHKLHLSCLIQFDSSNITEANLEPESIFPFCRLNQLCETRKKSLSNVGSANRVVCTCASCNIL